MPERTYEECKAQRKVSGRPHLRVALLGSRSLGFATFRALEALSNVRIVLGAYPGGDQKMEAATCKTPLQHAHWDKQPWQLEMLLRQAKPDVIVAAHWHAYVTKEMRKAAPEGVVAYHPSLLPRHRGIDAVKWTIRSRDPIAGGTVYRMDEGLDEGPIIQQRWCHVSEDWDASDLWREQLFPMGVDMLRDVIWKLGNGMDLPMDEQDEQFATYEHPMEVSR